MSKNIRTLKLQTSVPKEPSKSGNNVVKVLEEALAMAKEGLISNTLILTVNHDNSVMDCWANGNYPMTIVGGLESLKKEFMDAIIESRGRE